ncbi:kinase-like protein [Dacryopinax primogenitus]|uniref:Kinase-like protein n=1 Tax=Dacryopinax primogenitus (strain DJM 731) TaxID=1858805 RepID=M5G7T2_DACPD|nr:kinase-like protein [Dacryopinax primogenitus]EJU01942.1 kinase-like protein [Dacryopinax primogenitus]
MTRHLPGRRLRPRLSKLCLWSQCKTIEHALVQRSARLQSREVKEAVDKTRIALQSILDQSQTWLDNSQLRRSLNAHTIQCQLEEWNGKLNDCMQEFGRTIAFEILNVLFGLGAEASRFYDRMLNQGEAFTALLQAIERNTELMKKKDSLLMDRTEEMPIQCKQPTSQERNMLHASLQSQPQLPKVLPIVGLQGELEVDEHPTQTNTSSDLYRGRLEGRPVAVKRLRDANSNPARVANFMNEAYIWRALNHTNVLPFLGIHLSPTEETGIVTVWIPHGDAMHYINKKPDCYRRAIGIIHGDIRGSNILIDEVVDVTGVWPQARLTDFGLATSADGSPEVVHDATHASEMLHICRWLAPERCNSGPEGLAAPASDVFSFSRTILEITTGSKPFAKEASDFYLMKRLCTNDLWPDRPIGDIAKTIITDEVWELMMQMWASEPSVRSMMNEVQTNLERLL